MENLVSKTEFAGIADVTPRMVTSLVRGVLSAAVSGRLIDANHPDVVKYLQRRRAKNDGVEILYHDALSIFRHHGKCSAKLLCRELHIGADRAANLTKLIRQSGASLSEENVNETVSTIKTRSRAALKKKRVAPPPPTTKPLKAVPPPAEVKEDPDPMPEDIRAFENYTLREIYERFGSDTAFNDWLKAIKSIEGIETSRLQNKKLSGELVSVRLMKLGVIDPINESYRALITDASKNIALTIVSMTKSKASLIECELEVVDQISSHIKSAKAKMKKAMRDATAK